MGAQAKGYTRTSVVVHIILGRYENFADAAMQWKIIHTRTVSKPCLV